jgi:lysophospholipase L1-like esterase
MYSFVRTLRAKPLLRCAALLLSLSAFTLTSCTSDNVATVTAGPAPTSMWVVGWGAGSENSLPTAVDPGGSEQSFRFIVLPTTDGTQERVHFSNRLSTSPVTIGAARLAAAVDIGPAIDPTRDAALTFSGSSTVTLAAGQEVVSDPVNITYHFGEKLAVSVYLKGVFGPLTQHTSEVQTNFENASGGGDATADASGSSMPTSMTDWLMVNGIDIYGSFQGTVAVFGSSSVDGHASNDGDTNSYPTPQTAVAGQDNDRPSDWLARQLRAAGYRMGVLNAGAIGDPAAEDNGTSLGSSIAGVDRMQHDVLQQAGIKTVIIYFGGVDLRGDCKAAPLVEAALANMTAQAQAAGVRVILATVPPAEYCTTSAADLVPSTAAPYAGDINPGPENPGSVQRRAVNDWVRTSGAALPGVVAVADFDKALADGTHPDFMIPNLNSGDNFHPNGPGYGVQSSAIPLDKILGQ